MGESEKEKTKKGKERSEKLAIGGKGENRTLHSRRQGGRDY